MNKIYLFLIFILICCFFVGCKEEKKQKNEYDLSTTLIIYFSENDKTEQIANTIAKELDCGKFRIEPLYPYKKGDLDFNNPNSRISAEMNNPDSYPEIKPLSPLLEAYETVILGYPLWNGKVPCYLNSYLKVAGFTKGMRVIPFAVSDTDEMGNTAKVLLKKEKIKLEKGITFKSNTTENEIKEWIKSKKL